MKVLSKQDFVTNGKSKTTNESIMGEQELLNGGYGATTYPDGSIVNPNVQRRSEYEQIDDFLISIGTDPMSQKHVASTTRKYDFLDYKTEDEVMMNLAAMRPGDILLNVLGIDMPSANMFITAEQPLTGEIYYSDYEDVEVGDELVWNQNEYTWEQTDDEVVEEGIEIVEAKGPKGPNPTQEAIKFAESQNRNSVIVGQFVNDLIDKLGNNYVTDKKVFLKQIKLI